MNSLPGAGFEFWPLTFRGPAWWISLSHEGHATGKEWAALTRGTISQGPHGYLEGGTPICLGRKNSANIVILHFKILISRGEKP